MVIDFVEAKIGLDRFNLTIGFLLYYFGSLQGFAGSQVRPNFVTQKHFSELDLVRIRGYLFLQTQCAVVKSLPGNEVARNLAYWLKENVWDKFCCEKLRKWVGKTICGKCVFDVKSFKQCCDLLF